MKLVAHPYDLPSTTTTIIDQYPGKETVITQPGYHVETLTIEVLIKNQAFVSSSNGNNYSLFYNVRVKGNFGEDWTELYSYSGSFSGYCPFQSDSEYTVLSISSDYYPSITQVDCQVEAILRI